MVSYYVTMLDGIYLRNCIEDFSCCCECLKSEQKARLTPSCINCDNKSLLSRQVFSNETCWRQLFWVIADKRKLGSLRIDLTINYKQTVL